MPIYEYIAIDPQGKKIKGTVDADNIRAARQKLRAKKIFPTDVKEGLGAAASSTRDIRKYFKPSEKISQKTLAVLTRQLATLIGSGLPLVFR